MSNDSGQLQGWPPGEEDYPRQPSTSSSDGSSAETATQQQPDLTAWPWGFSTQSNTAYGAAQPPASSRHPHASYPTSSSQARQQPQYPSYPDSAFDFGQPGDSLWPGEQAAGRGGDGSTSFASSRGEQQQGSSTGQGVSLSMLDLISGPAQTHSLDFQPPPFPHSSDSGFASFAQQPPPADNDDPRRDSLDSGTGSAAFYPTRKHSRTESEPDEGSDSGAMGRQGAARQAGGRAPPSRKGSEHSGSGSNSGSGSGSGSVSGARPTTATDDKKIVQRADKSCKKCRERRVRCDRRWPTCDRCKKRRETCEWAPATQVSEVEEGSDQERIADLTAKVAQLERQLKGNVGSSTAAFGAGQQSTGSGQPQGGPSINLSPPTFAAPTFPFSSAQSSSGLSFQPYSSSSYNPQSTSISDTSPSSITATVQYIYERRLSLTSQESDVLVSYLMTHSASNAHVARSGLSSRLGEKGMVISLTQHLLDAALHACCSKLPGIKPLTDNVLSYKRNLEILTPPEQCHVAVLCALGARASPHSQLLGIESIALQDGTPSPPLYLYAGERREMACRLLESRARELCWQHGLITEAKLEHLDSLVGLVQLLIYEEILPNQSRFFLRNAVGMYEDIRQEAIEKGQRTSRDPKAGPGAALFLADAVIAAACSRPSYITTGELDLFFVSDSVPIPDFPGSDLHDELNGLLQRPLTREKLSEALTTASMWVCGCARLYAQLTTARRPGSASTLPLLKNLWTLIDKVHHAVQELQQLLVSLTVNQVSGCEDQPYSLEHFVLLGVRFDAILVDVINLMHGYLIRNRNGPGQWSEQEDDPLLRQMREESELRVRKCLKLSSFYAQLYLQSQDKHLVHHMLMQLEMLPDWSTLAAQRIGQPDGPISEEYELTENELDWFQQALELSSYYTPKAAHRLQKLAAARQHHTSRWPKMPRLSSLLRGAPNPTGPRPTVDSLNAQQAAHDSHQPQNSHYHFDLPPHANTSSIRPLNPPNDPSELYNVPNNFVPDPSQLYVFDSFGVAASQGLPLSSAPPVPNLDFVQQSFNGQSWLSPPDMPASASSSTPTPNAYLQPTEARGQSAGRAGAMGEQGGTIEVPQVGAVQPGPPAPPGTGMEWMRGGGKGASG
ncbi:hypothetical protein JCM8097_008877 [Rhodosporidiobolus ruineniae]